MPDFGIGLMCKPPRPGTSKTRLARDIGFDRAAALSRAFLIDSIATLRAASTELRARPFCFFKPADALVEMREFIGDDIPALLQDGGDLGTTMFAALRRILSECPDGAALIGADVPTLPARLVRKAFEDLVDRDLDAVFGPSEDGGYYLVAIRGEAAAPLFEQIKWSTSTVMQETRARASQFGLSIGELEHWYDVDDIAGLDRLIGELSSPERNATLGPAQATRAALNLSQHAPR